MYLYVLTYIIHKIYVSYETLIKISTTTLLNKNHILQSYIKLKKIIGKSFLVYLLTNN